MVLGREHSLPARTENREDCTFPRCLTGYAAIPPGCPTTSSHTDGPKRTALGGLTTRVVTRRFRFHPLAGTPVIGLSTSKRPDPSPRIRLPAPVRSTDGGGMTDSHEESLAVDSSAPANFRNNSCLTRPNIVTNLYRSADVLEPKRRIDGECFRYVIPGGRRKTLC